MKHILKEVALGIGLLGGIAVLAVTPVGLAHNGSHGSTDDEHTTTVAESETETGEDAQLFAGHSDGRGSLHARAQTFLTDKRKDHQEHSKLQRQRACEARQKGILKRTNAYAKAAERHLGNFDRVFMNVQAFYMKKELTVDNYNTLVTAATDKQSAAQAAVAALKDLDVQVDCTQSDPATTVASIKTAVADAKTALKEYRSAIKDLVVAVKTSVGTGTSAEGSDE